MNELLELNNVLVNSDLVNPSANEDILLKISEDLHNILMILNTLLGYSEVLIYIIIPLVLIVIALWWFFRQFLGTY